MTLRVDLDNYYVIGATNLDLSGIRLMRHRRRVIKGMTAFVDSLTRIYYC